MVSQPCVGQEVTPCLTSANDCGTMEAVVANSQSMSSGLIGQSQPPPQKKNLFFFACFVRKKTCHALAEVSLAPQKSAPPEEICLLPPVAPRVLPPGSDDCIGASISQWRGRLQRQVCSCLGPQGLRWVTYRWYDFTCYPIGINRVNLS